MACKRPGVRVPLAPQVREIIRKPKHWVQQQSTAAQRHDGLPSQPGSSPAPGRGLLTWPAEPRKLRRVLERPGQAECSIRRSVDTCPAARARRPFPDDSCRLRNRSGQPCPAGPVVLTARMPADGLSRGAAWCATGAASSVSRRGCCAPRRNSGPLGARRRSAGRGPKRVAAHGSGQGRCAGRAVWLAAGGGQNVLATPSEPSGCAPSLRRRQIDARSDR
jgi:hypothetical protein